MAQVNDEQIRSLQEAGRYDEAMKLVVEHYGARLFGFLCQRIGPSRAEDAYQATWVKAWRGFPTFAWRSRLLTWLCVIANRVVVDAQRRQGPVVEPLSQLNSHAPQLADPARSVSSIVHQKKQQEALERAMAQLNDADREVLAFTVQGLSPQEIQEATNGPSVDAIYQRISRAKKRLAEILNSRSKMSRMDGSGY